ncbi:MAG: M48 family metallopeptidase [Saccharofermentans sp.]|nr:M48 family metallopeptidase [Saccharofermentans sp.]
MNLRISHGGKVSVSASPRVSEKSIEEFLLSHADFIINGVDKMLEREQNSSRPVEYKDGEIVKVFGEKVALHVVINSGRNVIDYNYPDIYIKAKDEIAVIKTYEKWRRETLRDKIFEMYKYYYPMFAAKGVEPVNTIALRTMKSRWGVCMPSKRKLTFNTNLFEVPEELIAYVVVHELAHLIEANHSPKFWAQVESIMPDYKARRKMLREF